LQTIANQLPDAFTDNKKIIKSHIPAANTPAKIEGHVGQSINTTANESKARVKRGRPIGANDKIPRKRKAQENKIGAPEEALPTKQATKIDPSKLFVQNSPGNESPKAKPLKEESPEEESPEDEHVPENNEISINYISTGEILDKNKIVVDNIFSFKIVFDITRSNDDIEPQSVEECRRRNDWPMWKEAIQAELNSLAKPEVFGPVVQTSKGMSHVGYKWVFVRKRNEKNEIVRYKSRLVAQGFLQKLSIDYEETYSHVVDAIIFRFFISLVVTESLDMRLMDVVTTYLYGSFDNDIYMKIPEGYKMPEIYNSKSRSIFSIKLQRSLYGLKQSECMWYNRLSEYLLKERFENNPICPCVFIKKSESEFAIIAVYVDDLNLVGTPEELTKTDTYLKNEFEMKDLGNNFFCLGLQIEHF